MTEQYVTAKREFLTVSKQVSGVAQDHSSVVVSYQFKSASVCVKQAELNNVKCEAINNSSMLGSSVSILVTLPVSHICIRITYRTYRTSTNTNRTRL